MNKYGLRIKENVARDGYTHMFKHRKEVLEDYFEDGKSKGRQRSEVDIGQSLGAANRLGQKILPSDSASQGYLRSLRNSNDE